RPADGSRFKGTLDEFALYNRALSVSEIQAIYNAGGAGKCKPLGPVTYDLARDFSINSNPNGIWSYGWISSIGGPFTLMDTARTNEAPNFRIWSWSVSGFSPPDAHYNADTKTFFSDGGTFPPGTLWVCPGPENTPRNFGV